MYKYTLLTSVYNSDKHIDNYFSSISSQTVLPDEIILVDDTKNFLLKKKIKEFQNKNKIKVKILKNLKNLGPSKSLNKGLKVAKNNLIFRLDVDDVWKKNHAEFYLKKYSKNKECLIYCYSLKHETIKNFYKCDDFLVNENQTIHSSWLINRNICPQFSYKLDNPVTALEDYFTLSYYMRKNYQFFFETKIKTFVYKINLESHGRKYKRSQSNIAFRKKIAKKNLNFFYSKFRKDKKLDNNLKSYVKFIFKIFGFNNYLIYIFWTMDYFYLKRILR